MGDKITVGPVNRGLKTDRTPFNIDNDSFPTLVNAYQWRGRIKRKRGTSLLTRLQRFFSANPAHGSIATTVLANDGFGNGTANLFTAFSLSANFSLVPGSVIINDMTSGNLYSDNSLGVLTGVPGGTGTVNYASGVIVIIGAAGNTIAVQFSYFPNLPVMGLEEFVITSSQFPGTIAFDTTTAYNIPTTIPYTAYDVSFYKNPILNLTTLPGYVQKATWTPTSWNGQDYQQFWTVNYQGALWVTNGINVPFSPANIGMQYAPANTITFVGAAATTLTITIANCPLIIGDFVFVNEWTGANAATLNFQSGYVTASAPNTPALALKTITITFPFATIGAGPFIPGIIQYLTNRSDITKDSLRWYDGDPTDGNTTTPGFVLGNGWVNFAPPLSKAVYGIADLPAAQYYLVGARMIVPFKDRLLFLGPVVQTSAAGSQVYLQDVIIYSQNGTPYYTASFTGDASLATTVFNPILVPVNQTATANAYWEDQTGFGGFIEAGIDQNILTCGANEDVLIVGFEKLQTRLVYSGNDIVPFNFFIINSELGSASTFSVIVMDQGVMTQGTRGYIITGQTGTERVDLDIPDQVFEINLLNNGLERITAQRDFMNEWTYFTYPSNEVTWRFPNQTLQFNYRDNSWGIFNETYTTYGQFKKRTGYTWQNIGTVYPTWISWTVPWNAGASTLLQPDVIAGNQQGFVMTRDDGTDEANSLYIQSFSGNTITSPDHCLNNGDYIVINGALGTVGALVNGKIFSVYGATQNTFMINPSIGAGTYLGLGTIQRMYVPFIQTKQFPVAWGMARKTRLGPQQYLFTRTANGQIQLLIFLSQDAEDPFNDGTIVPDITSDNNSLIYSTLLYTCPESINLGLTPANTNLLMLTKLAPPASSNTQSQIWHRVNTSLIGDTVQIGFTMSDAQMRDTTFSNQFAEIEIHGFILDVTPSQVLA